jgi:uncharacterized protein YgiB involved in biofilm formation
VDGITRHILTAKCGVSYYNFSNVGTDTGKDMKRSKRIALTLLASASLAACGCSSEQATQREIYASKEKCVEDWGGDDKCEEGSGGRHYVGPHYIFRGGYPYYFPRGGGDPVPLSRDARFSGVQPGMKSPHSAGTLSTTHVSRGGFGRSSSLHGGGSKS